MKIFIPAELLSSGWIDPRYENSIFRELRYLKSKVAGTRYQNIVKYCLEVLGHVVEKPDSTEYDAKIDHKKDEIKGSMLNKVYVRKRGALKGTMREVFSFLQIRPDQSYDGVIFAMFYPHELVIMRMTKKMVMKHIQNGKLSKQHLGKKGNSGTYTVYSNKEQLLALGATTIAIIK